MRWLFSTTIILSSCLLFLVQPLCAKMLLPFLGGTPAVWNTCMVFFQSGLLLGYLYAHTTPRWLGSRLQAILHVGALVLAYFILPIHFPDQMNEDWHPVLWLLAMLTLYVGLPFILLASTAPLLQCWFVSRNVLSPRDPYFLYAASNLGSFVALGLYPFLLEPYFSLPQLAEQWKFGFLVLTALIAFCVPQRLLMEAQAAPALSEMATAPGRWLKLRWMLLAMIPSSLLLSVTTHLTTDIAAMPLLWLIPMGIYLMTFTLVFASRPLIPPSLVKRWLPLVVMVVSLVRLSEGTRPLALVVLIHLLGLFWLAMVCHGELARTRPDSRYLTGFYLYLSIGGALGGVLNALVAPLLFSGLYEYPIMLVLACGVGLDLATHPTRDDLVWAAGLGLLTVVLVLLMQTSWLISLPPGPLSVAAMFGLPLILCYLMQAHPARFALGLGAILLASGLYHGVHGASAHQERSYFGIHRVTTLNGFHRLVHGNTLHGQQNPDHPQTKLTYYSEQGPIGEVFRSFEGDARLKSVGVVGLGTGTLAAYARAGQEWTFFEIDPSVQRIAENPRFFTYLRDARGNLQGNLHIERGDARLQLQQSSKTFGLLVVDAFGSDAIPVHLLTREAMRVYHDHLQSHGILAFHISNEYVDLEPVLAALAQKERPALACFIREDLELAENVKAQGISPSVWVVLSQQHSDLDPLVRNTSWRPARARAQVKAWTDHFSNLLSVIRWGEAR